METCRNDTENSWTTNESSSKKCSIFFYSLWRTVHGDLSTWYQKLMTNWRTFFDELYQEVYSLECWACRIYEIKVLCSPSNVGWRLTDIKCYMKTSRQSDSYSRGKDEEFRRYTVLGGSSCHMKNVRHDPKMDKLLEVRWWTSDMDLVWRILDIVWHNWGTCIQKKVYVSWDIRR